MLRASIACFSLLCVLPAAVRGEDAPAAPAEKKNAAPSLTPVDPVPERFGRVTDTAKTRWGLVKNGSVGLSGYAETINGAFEFAAQLAVEGKDFTPEKAEALADSTHIRLTGKAGDFDVVRDVWIDAERAGARFIETIGNPTDEAKTVAIVSRTDMGDGVQASTKLDGRPLAEEKLAKDDAGFVATQDPQSTKAGVIFILGDPKSDTRPKLEAKDFRRDVVWTAKVPAKGKVAIVHWILQRPDLTPDQAKAAAEPFWRNGRLIRPFIDDETAKIVANFTVKGGDAGSAPNTPSAEEWLGPLLSFCQRLGIERGEEDVYWMGENSSLAGQVQGAPLTLESRFGKVTVPTEEVAAVQGSAGRGRLPRVFLRDGTVLTGALTLPDWKVAGSKGWTIGLNAETLDSLVLRTSERDGTPPGAASLLAQLSSGEILPLEPAAGQKLALTTPWGELEVELGQVAALWRLHEPAPACRLRLLDGSQLTVFPAPKPLAAQSARFQAITLDTSDLAALWRAGEALPEERNEIEEIISLDGMEKSFVLLKGSNTLAATLADAELTLVTGPTRTTVKTGDVAELRRTEASTDATPRFALKLSSGAEFEGTLTAPTLSVKTTTGTTWSVPVAHLLAVQHQD